jgi:hypothetical protein
MLIGAVLHAEQTQTAPSPAYITKPVISQGELTHRQVTPIMDALGFQLESTAPKTLGPDQFTRETWVKSLADGNTLKLFSLSQGPDHSSRFPRFSFEGIPAGPAGPATRLSGDAAVVDQYELTPAQLASLMNALGFEHEKTERHRDEMGYRSGYDTEAWRKTLSDDGALRFIIRMSHDTGPTRPVSFSYQGIPVR